MIATAMAFATLHERRDSSWHIDGFRSRSLLFLDTGCNDFSVSETDNDGDGWTQEEGDCDDQDGKRHPGATEV